MFRTKEWTSWLKVFVLMSIFSILQIPLTQYASGADRASHPFMDRYNLRIVNNMEEPVFDNNVLEMRRVQTDNSQIRNLSFKRDLSSPDKDVLVNSKTLLMDHAIDKTDKKVANYMNDPIEMKDSSNLETRNAEDIKNNDIGKPDDIHKTGNEDDGNNEEDTKNAHFVYLTIDDGPSGVSGKFLDILANYKVKATFFVLEPRVWSYSEIMNRMVSEGHQIGIHGVTHNAKKFYASRESAVGEINKTKAAIHEVVGIESLLVRTPYGSSPYLSREQEKGVQDAGYKIWDWNVDSRDWYYRDEDYIQNTIDQVLKISDRGIAPVILVHELEPTVKHLTKLIEYLIAHDYEFRTLSLNDEPVRL